MAANYDDALKFANEFCDKFDIEMNNGQMARFVNLLVAFREAAQQSLGWTCAVCQSTNLESDLECGYCDTPRPSR